MVFFKIINKKKFTLISIFLFLYVIFNLLEGERGLISYYEKQKIKEQLIQEKKSLVTQLNLLEKMPRQDQGLLKLSWPSRLHVGSTTKETSQSIQ